MMIKNVIREGLLIIIAASFIATTVNSFRPDGIALIRKRQASAPMKEGPASVVSIDEAIEKFRRGDALFVDARSSEGYLSGHIPGAINLPDQLFDDMIEEFMIQIDPQREIITYCGDADCHLAMDLAEKLCSVGFEHVLYFAGGFRLWNDYRMPVQKDLDRAISR